MTAEVVNTLKMHWHRKYLFLSYHIGLLPVDKENLADLDGKLKLEYYRLKEIFQGDIQFDNLDGQYVRAKRKGIQGRQEKNTLG